MKELEKTILAAWENREQLKDAAVVNAINEVVKLVNDGELRVANKNSEDKWITNEWVKKAIILYFPLRQMEVQEVGIFEFHDKMQLKNNYKALGVRLVPPAVARYGSYIAPGVILMPSYVNIGADVESLACNH